MLPHWQGDLHTLHASTVASLHCYWFCVSTVVVNWLMATIPVEVGRIQGLSSACLLLLQSSSAMHVPMCVYTHTHTLTHSLLPLPRSRKMSLSCISVCLITSVTRSNEVSPYTCNHRTAIIQVSDSNSTPSTYGQHTSCISIALFWITKSNWWFLTGWWDIT